MCTYIHNIQYNILCSYNIIITKPDYYCNTIPLYTVQYSFVSYVLDVNSAGLSVCNAVITYERTEAENPEKHSNVFYAETSSRYVPMYLLYVYVHAYEILYIHLCVILSKLEVYQLIST